MLRLHPWTVEETLPFCWSRGDKNERWCGEAVLGQWAEGDHRHRPAPCCREKRHVAPTSASRGLPHPSVGTLPRTLSRRVHFYLPGTQVFRAISQISTKARALHRWGYIPVGKTDGEFSTFWTFLFARTCVSLAGFGRPRRLEAAWLMPSPHSRT